MVKALLILPVPILQAVEPFRGGCDSALVSEDQIIKALALSYLESNPAGPDRWVRMAIWTTVFNDHARHFNGGHQRLKTAIRKATQALRLSIQNAPSSSTVKAEDAEWKRAELAFNEEQRKWDRCTDLVIPFKLKRGIFF